MKQLRDELNVSILVLTDSAEPGRSGIVGEAYLKCSRILCSVADSVFAIGHHPRSAGERYIVQTRSKSAPLFWSAHNAPVCRVLQAETGFLGMEFDERFVPQIDEETLRMICQVKSLRDSGLTYRAIERELGISKSQAAGLYKKWTPAMGEGCRQSAVGSGQETARQEGESQAGGGAQKSSDDHGVHKEEYHGQHTDWYFMSIGMRPMWLEIHLVEQNADCGVRNAEFESDDEREMSEAEAIAELCAQFEGRAEDLNDEPAAAAAPDDPFAYIKSLTVRLDGYGHEIYIESKDAYSGKPMIWYKLDDDGSCTRFKRDALGIIAERLAVPARA